MLNIVTVTSLYPNREMPRHGIFVEERLLHLVAAGDIRARVIAPVPWFPFKSGVFGRYSSMARVPESETRYGLDIQHPRYPAIPKVGMSLAPFLMAAALVRYVRKVRARTGPRLVIDAHYLYPDGVAAALLGHFLRLPVVLTARGQDVTLLTQFSIPRALMRWAVNDAAKVITVSDSLRTQLIGIGARPEKVITLRNGVDLDKFRPMDRSACRSRAGFTAATLLSVGNLVDVKNHELVIRAVELLPDVRLQIVGEGPLATPLRQLVAALGLGDRVSIVGNVPRAELVALYNAADALVLASRREGMPNVVLESLACGTPVIATAVGGIPEILTDPDAGAMVLEPDAGKLAQAIRSVLSKPPPTLRVRTHAEKFGWSQTIAGCRRVLQEASGNASLPIDGAPPRRTGARGAE